MVRKIINKFKTGDLEAEKKRLEYKKTFYATLIGALTVVAGLFWKDLLAELMELIKLQSWLEDLVATVLFTAIVAFIILKINSLNKKHEERILEMEEKLKKKK